MIGDDNKTKCATKTYLTSIPFFDQICPLSKGFTRNAIMGSVKITVHYVVGLRFVSTVNGNITAQSVVGLRFVSMENRNMDARIVMAAAYVFMAN